MLPGFTLAKEEVSTMSTNPTITLTTLDMDRLQRLLAVGGGEGLDRLDAELARADVVAPGAIAPDVVTMHSEVTYRDEQSGVERTVRLVYPGEADSARAWVSVLAPLGSALIGLRVGQHIDWTMPRGVRRLHVVAVPYQPAVADAAAGLPEGARGGPQLA